MSATDKLREEIHLKMLEKSGSATEFADLTVVPLGYAVTIAMALIESNSKERERLAFKHGQRVGQYQAADKLYGHTTLIYLFHSDESPKVKARAAENAQDLVKECEKYMNHNRKDYTKYLNQLRKQEG